jgi:hypothetical protein
MSEAAYKLVCSSIDIKDPTILKKKLSITEMTANNYLSEINSITQTDKRFGIKKTTYHSQVLFKVNASSTPGSAGLVFPFWQYLDATTDANNIDIGKVVLKIRHKTIDNSANTQLFRIVGTQQSGTEALTAATTPELPADTIMYTSGNTTITGSTSAHTAVAGTTIAGLGTAANLYQSPFYIAGEDASSASVDRTYEIDFNTVLKTSVTANKPIALGLRLNEAPADESIFVVEAHVEVITPDYTSYINTHTIA